ncbi:MAG: NADP(H)-dependent aldo-keto reductase [Pseudomonadota bacterium]|nr:NADP(H)-dependent aldo-keto reductase [Pseudomonadota bacterium]
MQYRRLGRSDLKVSEICLGTMTFGEQNTEEQAHQQLDYALEAGINFIDTAEMYPVPPKGETQGRTETYIGNWLSRRGGRDQLIIASKVAGRANWLPWIRDGQPRLDRPNIKAAVETSLKRLQTDYIDLYQLHWPDRSTNFFGKLGYTHRDEETNVPIAETLAALGELVAEGKIRHIGLSNETPWGTMRFLEVSERLGLPRVVSIQNPYNLLNRTFEIGLAEVVHREDVPLLAYSPMAFGVLSGKYLAGQRPAGARLTLFERFSRYTNAEAEKATVAYVELAREHGLNPAQMALAYVNSRPFLGANIIGATSMEQLRANVKSMELTLSDEVLKSIEAIHKEHPNPAP